MAGNSQYDFGRQVAETVEKALDSKNFEKLSENIEKVVRDGLGTVETTTTTTKKTNYGRTFDQAQQQIKYEKTTRTATWTNQNSYNNRSTSGAGKNYNRYGYNKYDFSNYDPSKLRHSKARQRNYAAGYGSNTMSKPLAATVYSMPKEESTGKVMKVGGIVGTVCFGFATFNGLMAGASYSPIVSAILMAISIGVLAAGVIKSEYATRFKRYVDVVSEKNYAEIDDLAKYVGRSRKSVLADLRNMIENNSFKQGHIDDDEKTFIATDELFEQYKKTQENVHIMEAEKAEKIKKGIVITDEVQQVLDTGDSYLRKIKKANIDMPEAVITEKLDRLENVIERIFARVKDQPSEASKLNQFMDYYLPTTMKLVEAYKEMDELGSDVETVIKTKEEILSSLDSINAAYEKILDSMFKEKALDVATDISVMKAMMKQDGLATADFKLDN